MASDAIRVQVCYAKPDAQDLRELAVPVGTTLREAVVRSGILQDHSDIDLDRNRVGIFGKVKPLDTILQQQDRIEIYRPLIADPKETRRQRIAKKKRD